MTDRTIVLTTAGTREEAQRIARALVESRQAACVNIVGPMESVYRWKGAVETASEWLLLVKTTAAALEKIRQTIRELHSYELPECIEIPVEGGSAEYLAWIGEEVRVK
jgi:periplasmic divalent cation tolerance protein